MEELESGSFATIYKSRDCYRENEAPRLLSAEHCAMVQIVAKDSPEIEFVQGDTEDFSEEKKQALEVLGNLASVFPNNDTFVQVTEISENGRLVAVKKSKINSFNDRDGILFYALREAQIL